ncbi:dTDP-4-dehydrorhamnose 3,5-epimerase [Pseudoduganella sp. SL102]|uniref:dTDP-4-dehydrorhamnose 3,5-epimerase n=1 Tax=Pseudoduganella sp. SL102 TaxID=2995154 RepID=UPI00248C49DB|nr:dTDP-4-dehydrorhamnose 3,5-epimerase [Pseudoduganella sp. SL102]WBS02779.1 dTDP-4-dehydrorhamnose 3,5-epimerase [Pseudoduganella sp. SL102]
MVFSPTSIHGCYELSPGVFRDQRGSFVKVFHEELFQARGLASHFAEDYYTLSRRGVLRGLHFQTPPHDHAKLVYCPHGAILDVALDLRLGSPTHGQHVMLELSAEKANMLYLPPGLAHGFYALSEQALVAYKVTTIHAPESDSGVHWDSAGIPWPDREPVISPRDSALVPFDRFASPFKFQSGRT